MNPQIETKHYLETYYPGFLVSDTSVEEVDHRDPKRVELDDRAYAFRFFDRTVTTTPDGEALMGKPKNHSGLIFPEGRVMTPEDVERDMPGEKILISNMRCNGYKRVVHTKFGQTFPLNDEDVVLGDIVPRDRAPA